jgi:uncharacterized membrane protein
MMKPRRPTRRVRSLALLACLVAVGYEAVDVAQAHDHHDEGRPETAIADTTVTIAPNVFCPVLTGRRVDPAIHATHDGREVRFCCAMCRRKFLANPGAYLANLPQFGGVELPSHIASDSTAAGRRAPVAEPSRGDQPSAVLLARLGWFHPLAVHFPIAFLLAAALAEWLAVFLGWQTASRAVPCLLNIAAPSAILAMLLGFTTAASADSPADLSNTFVLHRIAGIATAVLAVFATATMSWRESPRRARRALWLGLLLRAAVAVAVAGHFGAILVHGHGPFLFSSGGS